MKMELTNAGKTATSSKWGFEYPLGRDLALGRGFRRWSAGPRRVFSLKVALSAVAAEAGAVA
jgi:hypothetical protein